MSKMVTRDWFAAKRSRPRWRSSSIPGRSESPWPLSCCLPSRGAAGFRRPFYSRARSSPLGWLRWRGSIERRRRHKRPARQAPPRPGGRTLLAVIVAGLIWDLYNGAIAMVFSFRAFDARRARVVRAGRELRDERHALARWLSRFRWGVCWPIEPGGIASSSSAGCLPLQRCSSSRRVSTRVSAGFRRPRLS